MKEDESEFPNGGWTRQDSINEDKWLRYQPQPVLLLIQSFMAQGHDKTSHPIETVGKPLYLPIRCFRYPIQYRLPLRNILRHKAWTQIKQAESELRGCGIDLRVT